MASQNERGGSPLERILNTSLTKRELLKAVAVGIPSAVVGYTAGRMFPPDLPPQPLPPPQPLSDEQLRQYWLEQELRNQLEEHVKLVHTLYAKFVPESLREKYQLSMSLRSKEDLARLRASQDLTTGKLFQVTSLGSIGTEENFLSVAFSIEYDGNRQLSEVNMAISTPLNTRNPIATSLDEVRPLITETRHRSGMVYPEGIVTKDHSLAFASRVLSLPSNTQWIESDFTTGDFPLYYEGKAVTDDDIELSLNVGNKGVYLTVENPSNLFQQTQ